MFSIIQKYMLRIGIGVVLSLSVALTVLGWYTHSLIGENASLEEKNRQNVEIIGEQKRQVEGLEADIRLRDRIAVKHQTEIQNQKQHSEELSNKLREIQNEVKDLCFDSNPNPALRLHGNNNQD